MAGPWKANAAGVSWMVQPFNPGVVPNSGESAARSLTDFWHAHPEGNPQSPLTRAAITQVNAPQAEIQLLQLSFPWRFP